MHSNDLLGHCRFRIPRAGVFEAAFPFTNPSARDGIELRLVSERGAIEGTLGIEQAVLTCDSD
jgi:hypothetical protein